MLETGIFFRAHRVLIQQHSARSRIVRLTPSRRMVVDAMSDGDEALPKGIGCDGESGAPVEEDKMPLLSGMALFPRGVIRA